MRVLLRVLRRCHISSVKNILHSLSWLTQTPSRIVPGFLVQTGDKTGTGGGGESVYGGVIPI